MTMMDQADWIRVTVKFLARYQEEAGAEEVDLMFEPPVTVGDVLETLKEKFPGWGATVHEPLVARNLEYARPAEAVADGDEIAVFPPVSGG